MKYGPDKKKFILTHTYIKTLFLWQRHQIINTKNKQEIIYYLLLAKKIKIRGLTNNETVHLSFKSINLFYL